MTVNTGEGRRDTETMKDRNIITGEVRIEMMRDKTTITGEVKKGTEMMKDKKITRGEVRIDTEMMILTVGCVILRLGHHCPRGWIQAILGRLASHLCSIL